ncbi:hypothetical protein MMC07_000399 [Pseudocyphellaria aurata]|nr:hypothetical protein [Pseudocyphellaria aurata]
MQDAQLLATHVMGIPSCNQKSAAAVKHAHATLRTETGMEPILYQGLLSLLPFLLRIFNLHLLLSGQLAAAHKHAAGLDTGVIAHYQMYFDPAAVRWRHSCMRMCPRIAAESADWHATGSIAAASSQIDHAGIWLAPILYLFDNKHMHLLMTILPSQSPVAAWQQRDRRQPSSGGNEVPQGCAGVMCKAWLSVSILAFEHGNIPCAAAERPNMVSKASIHASRPNKGRPCQNAPYADPLCHEAVSDCKANLTSIIRGRWTLSVVHKRVSDLCCHKVHSFW